MAVDTRNRRSSCLGFAGPARQVLPNPDGTVGQADRQQAAYSYPGILAVIAGGSAKRIRGAALISRTLTGAAPVRRTMTGAALIRRTIPGAAPTEP